MEKIKTVIDTGRKTKDGTKPILTIELEDGRKGTAFDEKFKELQGKEIEIDIKEIAEYHGNKQFIYNLKGEQKKGGFPQKDYKYEKKKIALECAVRYHGGGVGIGEEKIIETANKFLNYLNL